MASEKQRRKRQSLQRRQSQAGSPPRPPRDGDRRRRTEVDPVRQVLQRKQALRDWTIDTHQSLFPDLPTDEPE